ncbi:MAG: hypothetical protein WC490_04870 [Candidatus Margulisiibacteriota bacterium]
MFFLAKRYPTYEAPLMGTSVAPPVKQYIPEAWAGDGKKYVFEARDGEAGYDKWEKTSLKFFEMFKWMYEYMGKSSNHSVSYTDEDGIEQTMEIEDGKDISVRDYRGKDLLDEAKEKSKVANGFKYKNMSGADVRTCLSGYSSGGNPDMDPTDPFGFMDLVRNSTVQVDDENDHTVLRKPVVTDHAHYQRLISLGGNQTGIPFIRSDSLLSDKKSTEQVQGLHVSSFESAGNYAMTPLITQFEDPSEMIPLVHPTDINFAEEFMMGLWKDDDWGRRYLTMPTFSEYFKIPSRSEAGIDHDFASQFDTTGSTIKYGIYDANGRFVKDFDTGLSSSLLDDTVRYETGLDEFMASIKAGENGSIAWISEELNANPYSYLVGNSSYKYSDYIGDTDNLTDGMLDKAKSSLKTVNFAQKMVYSILMISSGIFDLVGGWDYRGLGLEDYSQYVDISNSWSKDNKEKGISDFHMGILSQLTSYIHPVTYAMRQMIYRGNSSDAAHSGYVYINSQGERYSFLELFVSAYADLKKVLCADADNDPETEDPSALDPNRMHISSKLEALHQTLTLTSNPTLGADGLFCKLYASYGTYYGNGDKVNMVKEGIGKDQIESPYVFYNGKEQNNPFYRSMPSCTWNQWYAASYEYMDSKNSTDVWTMIQMWKSQRNYANAKAEYKAAKKQTEAMEEAEEQRDKAYAEKRRGEMQAANQAAEARQRSRQAELKNMAAKSRKK